MAFSGPSENASIAVLQDTPVKEVHIDGRIRLQVDADQDAKGHSFLRFEEGQASLWVIPVGG